MPHDSTAPPQPIAPWAHTVALFVALALVALLGHTRAASSAVETGSHLVRYTSSILLEWLLLGAVIAGIYHRRDFFVAAFPNRTRSLPATLALGVAVYISGFISIAVVGIALYFTPLFHMRNQAVVLAMLPHTAFEFVLWFLVSLTAGICEEIIFRGYLLQQLTAWTKRPIAAIVLAGMLFGCIHLYEGVAAIIPLAALGILFGFVVRHFKGDLRAVIIAHALHDFITALIALALPFLRRYQPHA